jgi:hypothetical protein
MDKRAQQVIERLTKEIGDYQFSLDQSEYEFEADLNIKSIQVCELAIAVIREEFEKPLKGRVIKV